MTALSLGLEQWLWWWPDCALPQRTASAYGPRAQLVLPDGDAKALIESRSQLELSARRRRAWRRYLVLTDAFLDLIKERIAQIQVDESTRQQIYKHCSLVLNPARDITRDTCMVWAQAPTRTIEGISDEQAKAFASLVEESGYSFLAKAWNRQASYLGPVLVLPVVRGRRLTFDAIPPHAYDVAADVDNPWGRPAAAIWNVEACNHSRIDSVILDANSWRYYSGTDQVSSVTHSIGAFPGAVLRFDEFGANGWWGVEPGARLQDVTLRVGFISAVMDYVRKSQNRKLMTAIGDIEGIPKGQVANAEVPLEAHTKSPELVSINAIDLVTDPDPFITHITWLIQSVAASYGGSVSMGAVPNSSSMVTARVSFDYNALTEIRNDQLPGALAFEREIWPLAVTVAKRSGHPLAAQLPNPQDVEKGLRVQFPRLARSFASIDEEIKYWDFALAKGKASYGDLLRGDVPGATDVELDELVAENVERQMPIIEAMTKRDLSLNPQNTSDTSLKTVSQINGAEGPRQRDAKRDD